MSFVFRGTRGDIESGFPGFIPERRQVRVHAGRPINTNSMAFLPLLASNYCLFMILNSYQMSPNFLVFNTNAMASSRGVLMATSLRMYATCQQIQAQAQAHAAATSGLLGQAELRLHMPPSIAFATRGRVTHCFADYETLRDLDYDNGSSAQSMSEEEINAIPVHKYKSAGPQRQVTSPMNFTIIS
ncbi:hypothetical protein MKX01_001424 [Papaver californicum]|nr:hypothetical protein MKX01_001424 [Papaver californicum]